MTTPRAVATELRQTLDALREIGLVVYANSVLESPTRVSWHTPGKSEADFLLNRDDTTIDGYLHWLDQNFYSAVFRDGSLLQITYEFSGGEVSGHRLAFVPCPVKFDRVCYELLDEGYAIADVVRVQLSQLEKVMMKSTLRFDFDPANARENHPAAHFTLNSVDCRIACATPFRLGRFLEFVFRNFYPAAYSANPFLRSLDLDGWFKQSITEDERLGPHISWNVR